MKRDETNPACEHARELLASRVEGALSQTDERSLDEHLKSCQACRDVASWIGDVDALSAAAPLPGATATELEAIEAAVMEGIRAGASRPAPQSARRRGAFPRWFLPSAAAAATIAFLSWWQIKDGELPLTAPEPAPANLERLADEQAQSGRAQDVAGLESDRLSEGADDAEEVAQRENAPQRAKLSTTDLPAPAERKDRALASASVPEAGAESPPSADPVVGNLQEKVESESEQLLGEVGKRQRAVGSSFDADADGSSNELRLALRDARATPTRENVIRLLDAWPTAAKKQVFDQVQPQAMAAPDARRAQLRREEFAELSAELPSPSFSDSLRSFLQRIAEDEEHADLRLRVQRLLEELPQSRE